MARKKDEHSPAAKPNRSAPPPYGGLDIMPIAGDRESSPAGKSRTIYCNSSCPRGRASSLNLGTNIFAFKNPVRLRRTAFAGMNGCHIAKVSRRDEAST